MYREMRRFIAPAFLLVLLVSGCKFGQYPNPNDPDPTIAFDGATLQKNVQQVNEMLVDRVLRGELDRTQKKAIFHEYIAEQLADVDVAEIPDEQAWRYADVFRQMDDWQTTHELYVVAVANAFDEDRRVNDTLRLAEATAQLGDVNLAIDLVRSTFNVAPEGKAPILMATLYEFVPAALENGGDMEVARLLEEAAAQHLQTVVDPNSDSGKAFILTRFHHLREAWSMIVRIYRINGDRAEMRGAINRSEKMLRMFASV